MLHLLIFPGVIVAIAGIVLAIARFAGLLDCILLRKTNVWYATMVQRLPLKGRLLDVGSGIAQVRTFGELLCGITLDTLIGTVQIARDMEVELVGLQENDQQFKDAYQKLMRAGLKTKLPLHNKSICDTSLRTVFGGAQGFNAFVFSTPLVSLQDPVAALRASTSLLKEGGVVYIPQVYNSSSAFLWILSPILRLLHVAPIAEVVKVALEAGMEVVDDVPAVGVDIDGQTPQAARLLSLRRSQGTTSDLKQSSPVAGSDSKVRSRKGNDSKQ